MRNEKLEAVVYEECLKAAIAMGDELNGLSWFGKNWASQSFHQDVEAEAA
jgi:hypothetical protein